MSSQRRQWRYFFPFQLLLLHLKKNHFLLGVWVLLFAIVTGNLGQGIGVPKQFLVPEYFGHTGMLSFAMLGFSIGGFISGYNLFTYMRHGYRFPVIATLSRPFHKFCINNFLLPAIFIVVYLVASARFQSLHECIPAAHIVLNLFAFLVALVFFQFLSYFYFLHTNKEATAFGSHEEVDTIIDSEDSPVDSTIHSPMHWISNRLIGQKWRVDSYMSSVARVSWARDGRHYKREILQRVFRQNQINASRFELLILISFLFLGAMASNEWFILPAAASLMLFLTMLIMVISALHSWLRGWTLTVVVAFVALLNLAHNHLTWFRNPTKAYGLNYEVAPVAYQPNSMFIDSMEVQSDVTHTEDILHRRLHAVVSDGLTKPKLVILIHSGGGTRSAYWTMRAIPYADSVCNGKLLKHTVLMTGASGGMVGAAYLRELMLQKESGRVDLNDPRYRENMGMDLLNPVVLAGTTGDWFIPYRRLNDDGYSYSKDRATALEEQLERNTGGAFNKRLGDYTLPEKEGRIPLLILTPTIANDGRRLIVGSQPYGYLCTDNEMPNEDGLLNENIEFARLFSGHNAMHLRFASALRMNATFPYVTPMSQLPSEPPLKIIDAGIRDTYGWKTTCRFIHAMRSWIEANTSGVVIVQVRDIPRNRELKDHSSTLFSSFSDPFEGIYKNLTRTQNYSGEETLHFLKSGLKVPVETVRLQLEQSKEQQISLSWHLTRAEKNYIYQSVEEDFFKSELNRLKKLLGE